MVEWTADMDDWEDLIKDLKILIIRAEQMVDSHNYPNSEDKAILQLKEALYWAEYK